MGGYFLGSLAVFILCSFLSLFSALTYYLINRLSVKDSILKIDGIEDVDLKLVWDPPWTKDKMSEAAKLELNL